MILAASDGHAITISFDDVTNLANDGSAPEDGYLGLTWSLGGGVLKPIELGEQMGWVLGSGYANGLISGDFVAYSASGRIEALPDAVFSFNDVYLTAAWNNQLQVEFVGLREGVEIYNRTVLLDATEPTHVSFHFLGIDTLTMHATGGVGAGFGFTGPQFALDDMRINEVPEPASALMVLGGLVLIGANERARRPTSR